MMVMAFRGGCGSKGRGGWRLRWCGSCSSSRAAINDVTWCISISLTAIPRTPIVTPYGNIFPCFVHTIIHYRKMYREHVWNNSFALGRLWTLTTARSIIKGFHQSPGMGSRQDYITYSCFYCHPKPCRITKRSNHPTAPLLSGNQPHFRP